MPWVIRHILPIAVIINVAQCARVFTLCMCKLSFRCVNKEDMTVDETKLKVMWEDFEVALTEVQPKFGAPTADLEAYFSNGIVQYGEGFSEMERRLNAAVRE